MLFDDVFTHGLAHDAESDKAYFHNLSLPLFGYRFIPCALEFIKTVIGERMIEAVFEYL